ncbi:hypothetical protein K0038_01449 [Pseudomonas syringae]|uniref:hypothetical protein n=1 Tax=Pseudomonas syringae TaxID=317 RepID=UPI001CA7B7B7|nr:hypothetical protein [Pseudomonas syringae]MCI3944435.1 hypothetical protein [Pseudomonas syringae]
MYNYENTPTLRGYYDALQRMIKDETIIVSPGTRISAKNVALEAGKSESAIKKGRAVYTRLIAAIDIAAKEKSEKTSPAVKKVSAANERHREAKAKARNYKDLYEMALSRELMLLAQLDEKERSLRNQTNVIPFQSSRKR